MNHIRDKPASTRPAEGNTLLHLLIKLLAAAVLSALLFIFAIGIYPQHGIRMYPAVRDGDLVVTIKIRPSYQTGTVVGYRTPAGKLQIGRIVAAEGETVSFTETGYVEVNGLLRSEEIFFPAETAPDSDITFPYMVPEGCFFILNDQRTQCDDSRTFGAVSREDLRGSAFWLFRRREF